MRVAIAKSILSVSGFEILAFLIKKGFVASCSSTSLGGKDRNANSGCLSGGIDYALPYKKNNMSRSSCS